MTIPNEKLAKDIIINEIKIRELEKEIALIKEKLEIQDILGEMINRIDRRLSLYIYEQENKLIHLKGNQNDLSKDELQA